MIKPSVQQVMSQITTNCATNRSDKWALLPERSADICGGKRVSRPRRAFKASLEDIDKTRLVIDATSQRQHRQDHDGGHRYCGESRRQAIDKLGPVKCMRRLVTVPLYSPWKTTMTSGQDLSEYLDTLGLFPPCPSPCLHKQERSLQKRIWTCKYLPVPAGGGWDRAVTSICHTRIRSILRYQGARVEEKEVSLNSVLIAPS